MNVNPIELAEKNHREALLLFDKLNILRADVYPKVSQHIETIIETIQKIIDNGYGYETKTGVYFDVEKFKDYGRLSSQNIEEIKDKHRVEVDETKKSPIDFALWKKTKPGEEPIGWDSPWGYGRPGWHIECSAMSMRYTNGETLDIHGGAKDLIFPHHENEIAQSEAAFGKKFVKYWIHTGFLTINGKKMSKSLGNFITIEEALKKAHPMWLRLLFISTKYSSPIDYSDALIEQMKEKYKRIKEAYISIIENIESNKASKTDVKFREKIWSTWKAFLNAMDDDFNTSNAIAEMFEFIRELNKHMANKEIDKTALKISKYYFDNMLFILGIDIKHVVNEKESNVLKAVVSMRERFRAEKNYDVADKIRDMLKEHGYEIYDTPEGPKVRRIWGD